MGIPSFNQQAALLGTAAAGVTYWGTSGRDTSDRARLMTAGMASIFGIASGLSGYRVWAAINAGAAIGALGSFVAAHLDDGNGRGGPRRHASRRETSALEHRVARADAFAPLGPAGVAHGTIHLRPVDASVPDPQRGQDPAAQLGQAYPPLPWVQDPYRQFEQSQLHVATLPGRGGVHAPQPLDFPGQSVA